MPRSADTFYLTPKMYTTLRDIVQRKKRRPATKIYPNEYHHYTVEALYRRSLIRVDGKGTIGPTISGCRIVNGELATYFKRELKL